MFCSFKIVRLDLIQTERSIKKKILGPYLTLAGQDSKNIYSLKQSDRNSSKTDTL